jgi:hypothetical protein
MYVFECVYTHNMCICSRLNVVPIHSKYTNRYLYTYINTQMYSHLMAENSTKTSCIAGRGVLCTEEWLLQHGCGDEESVDLRAPRVCYSKDA